MTMTGPVPDYQYEAALRVLALDRDGGPSWHEALAVVRRAIRCGVARVCAG